MSVGGAAEAMGNKMRVVDVERGSRAVDSLDSKHPQIAAVVFSPRPMRHKWD